MGSRQLPVLIAKAPPPSPQPAPAKTLLIKQLLSRKPGRLFLFCGVILPLAATIFELSTHFCAQHFFDPFPSSNHVVLFMLIPLSNYLAWLSTRKDMSAHYGFMSLISGMAMGIGCLYALMFLPLTAASAMYTLFFGFGLLGLAPLFSIPCTWIGGRTVCHLAARKKTFFDSHQVEHIGHLIVLCMVIAIEFPSTATRINLSKAADNSKEAVAWLRQFGSEEVMLRACYERSGRATDILGSMYESGHPLSIEKARAVFYQVTGKPFNSVPIPAAARSTIQHAGLVDDPAAVNANVKDEFDLDADIAGENVSGVARGLSISQSRIAGTICPDAAVSELQWSVVFKNVSKYDREGRAKLLLPPGGVVTKATVVVNGVERDATISLRSSARTYYRQSLVEQKAPLLVSTCGVDQVLIQCFPVQPNGAMEVKLMIAAPLVLSSDKDRAALVLPVLEERNFQIDCASNIDIHASSALTSPATNLSASTAGSDYSISGNLDSAQLARFGGTIWCNRNADVVQATSETSSAADGSKVAHIVSLPNFKTPKTLVILVDGSASMKNYMAEIANALTKLPPSMQTQIMFVGDNPWIFRTPETLLQCKPAGGQADDVDLVRYLTNVPNLSVLWIHGPQPISTENKIAFGKLLSIPSDTPKLFDLQVAAGPNEILNDLNSNANFFRVPRVGTITADLERLVGEWNSQTTNTKQFELTNANTDKTKKGVAAPAYIDKLFGYEKLIQQLQGQEGAQSNQEAALAIASQYQIVSPVSSAVVMDFAISPAIHPAPSRDAKVLEFNPATLAKKQMQDKFAKVVNELNSLSNAASTSKDAEPNESLSAQTPAAQSQFDSGMKRQEANTAAPARETEKAAQMQSAEVFLKSSQIESKNLRLDGRPELNGATNGLIGAPVDPRYGQSNEVGEIRNAGSVDGGLHINAWLVLLALGGLAFIVKLVSLRRKK